jgi:hypothetical protein
MKSKLDPATTPDEKMQAFDGYLGQVLKCSKTQLDSALEYEKKMSGGKPKRGPKPFSASGHVSGKRD